MKTPPYLRRFLSLFCFIFLFAACSDGKGTPIENDLKTEGFILKVGEDRLLIAENITAEKYQEIKNKTIQELEKARVSLTYLRYNHENSLKEGDMVAVWIDGGVEHSYPAQAKVKKIELMK